MGRVGFLVGRVGYDTSRTAMQPYFECNPLKAFHILFVHPIEAYPDMNPGTIRTHISLRHL